jgi:hypothetical protein
VGDQPNPYRCRYCGAHEVVPSLTLEHEAACVARPSVVAA